MLVLFPSKELQRIMEQFIYYLFIPNEVGAKKIPSCILKNERRQIYLFRVPKQVTDCHESSLFSKDLMISSAGLPRFCSENSTDLASSCLGYFFTNVL